MSTMVDIRPGRDAVREEDERGRDDGADPDHHERLADGRRQGWDGVLGGRAGHRPETDTGRDAEDGRGAEGEDDEDLPEHVAGQAP